MEVLLRPLTWDNIDDVIVNSDSGTKYYDLPRNEDEAYWRLSLVDNHRRHNRGDWFNAYGPNSPTQIVGGGQFYSQGEIIDLGWWVVKHLRQRGYGKAIVRALENEAMNQAPSIRRFEASVDRDNEPSLALARSMGYMALRTEGHNKLILGKDISWSY